MAEERTGTVLPVSDALLERVSTPSAKPKALLFAFVSEIVEHKRRLDYYATTVDELGNVVAQHTGPTEEDCMHTLLGMRPYSPWLDTYDAKFPQGWEITWVEDPKNDLRIQAIEERYRRDYKPEGPSGVDDNDPEGNPEELFDALNQPVRIGGVCWEPAAGSFDEVRHPLEKLEDREDWRQVTTARHVFSDPLIADSRRTSSASSPRPAPD